MNAFHNKNSTNPSTTAPLDVLMGGRVNNVISGEKTKAKVFEQFAEYLKGSKQNVTSAVARMAIDNFLNSLSVSVTVNSYGNIELVPNVPAQMTNEVKEKFQGWIDTCNRKLNSEKLNRSIK